MNRYFMHQEIRRPQKTVAAVGMRRQKRDANGRKKGRRKFCLFLDYCLVVEVPFATAVVVAGVLDKFSAVDLMISLK